MNDSEAIAEFERWLAHIERQKLRAEEMQRLARLAKTDPDEARRQKRQIDSTPKVYDGGYLEPAVRYARKRLKSINKSDT